MWDIRLLEVQAVYTTHVVCGVIVWLYDLSLYVVL